MKSLKEWAVAEVAPTDFLQLPEHPILLQILYNRGLRDEEGVAGFLSHAHAVREDPYRLKDLTKATQRILHAIRKQEVICVYGDFDADGVTSTALLVEALTRAGARAGAYIPDRVDEGYGLNVQSIQEKIAGKASLLITVDCGIRSHAEVAAATQMGMDVIVTDHHSIGAELPPALAVINPRRADCKSGTPELAGVGVAYRLAQGVLRAVAQKSWGRIDPEEVEALEQGLLDLVALGTVADMMPVTGPNRSLIHRGIGQMQQNQRAGLAALMEHAAVNPRTVDSNAVSFRLAPRINAAGRLKSAMLAYHLLRQSEYEEAYKLAHELEGLNKERQDLTRMAKEEAQIQLGEILPQDLPLLFVASDRFLPGIVGLVAGRLADEFYRPAVVVELGEEECRGSARSIAEFDITAALDQVADLLVRHGGHSQAAGFTVRRERLPELEERLTGLADAALTQREKLRPILAVDAVLAAEEIDYALYDQLARLEPTGAANPQPLFQLNRGLVRDVRSVGRQNDHLKLTLGEPGKPVFDAIAFRQGHRAPEIRVGDLIDLVFHLETNEWQGRTTLQLNVQDLRQSGEGEGSGDA